MGRTDANGEIMMYGVHDGDRAMLQHGDSFRYATLRAPGGKAASGKTERHEMLSNAKTKLKPFLNQIIVPPNPYIVKVSAMPGITTDTLHINVSTTTTLAEAPLVMVWLDDTTLPQPILPAMAWNAAQGRYEGTVIMDVRTDPEGFILAETIDIDAEESAGGVRFQFISPPSGDFLEWGGAEAPLGLRMKASSYPEGAILAFEKVGRPDINEALLTVKGPYRLYSGNGKDLNGRANISMSYAMDLDEAFRTSVEEMALYQWDEDGQVWVELKTQHFRRHNFVSAPISSLGIFLLAGPPAPPPATGLVSY